MTTIDIREQFAILFNNMVKYGYLVRKHKLDGKIYWTNAEKVISPNNIFLNTWSVRSYIFYDDLKNMGIIEDPTMITTHDDWQYNHFLLQHGRLARKECYLNRLLQIAYNGGQLAYCLKNLEGRHVYTYERIEYYMINSMGTWRTYIDPHNVLAIATKENSNKIEQINKWLDNQISQLNQI